MTPSGEKVKCQWFTPPEIEEPDTPYDQNYWKGDTFLSGQIAFPKPEFLQAFWWDSLTILLLTTIWGDQPAVATICPDLSEKNDAWKTILSCGICNF